MKPSPPPTRRGEKQEGDVQIAGVIVGLKVAKSKRSGELYAQASLEDTVGKIDLICFPKDYAALAESLKIEVPVVVRGSLRAEEDAENKLAVSSIMPIEELKVRLPKNLRIKVQLEVASDALLQELHGMLHASPGPGRVMLSLEQKGEYCVVLEPSGCAVTADRAFIDRAELLLGRGAVQLMD
jgi:DNA polymerase-3 subunit alpha